MGELVSLRGDSHEQLGLLALDNLAKRRTDLALRNLIQAWLDASSDREAAWPIAQQLNELVGNGGAAA